MIDKKNKTQVALRDLEEGVKKWELWGRMGVDDMRRRYRRTFFGPFWHSLSMAIFVITSGILFSTLWKMKISEYLPFLCSGMIAWLPISAIMTESCTAFSSASGILTQVRLPYSMFVISVVWRNLLLFSHHFVVYVILVIIFSVPVNANSCLLLVGLASLVINGLWMGLVIALLATRYRDIQPVMTSFLQIIMFITPVFWPPSLLQHRALGLMFVKLNPFYYFIQSIRMPLLGQRPEWFVLVGIIVTAVLGWSFALFLFSRYRSRITYWL
jgi:lipopolysaccharide transport system permease protein